MTAEAPVVFGFSRTVTALNTEGSISSPRSVGGRGNGAMTRSAASRRRPRSPLMVALVSAATRRVVTVNGTLAAPAGTITDAGTRATPSLLESRTSVPLPVPGGQYHQAFAGRPRVNSRGRQ